MYSERRIEKEIHGSFDKEMIEDDSTEELVWICGKCKSPTVGAKWNCQACGAEAGGISEGGAFRSPKGVVVATRELPVSMGQPWAV